MRLWLLSIPLLILPILDDDTFTSETHGFRIRRPDASWTFEEKLVKDQGLLTLTIQSRDAPARVQVQVHAKLQDEPAAAREVRDALIERLQGKPEHLEMEKGSFKIRGKAAPGLSLLTKSGGETFLVRIGYIVKDGMVYRLQCHAPEGKFEDHARTFKRAWDSFRITGVSDEIRRKQRIRLLASKCGTEIDWAETWEEASRQAHKEKKLVLVYARLLSAFQISDSTMAGAFMDPDILDIIRERFVALRYNKGMEVPFSSQESYGMGPSTFGTSLLLVTPKGRVVGDTASLDATSLHVFLVEKLKRRPDFPGESMPRGLKGADRAEWHLKRGEYEEAREILESPSSDREHRLRGSLMRRLRRGEEALAEMEDSLEGAVVLIGMGRVEEAVAVIEKHPDDPEALYYLGACRWNLAGAEEAAKVWHDLIEKHEESRWAWRAAAHLESTGFGIGLRPKLGWPPEEILDVCRVPDPERVKVKQAEEDAVEYLLSRQREDGSWISPAEVRGSMEDAPHAFTTAITAMCAQSLLGDHDDAVERAVKFLLKAREKEKAAGPKVYFMDYSIYSYAYSLWLFADCIRSGLVDAEKLRPVMEGLIADMRSKQRENGGWSYYLTTDLANAGNPAAQSISFVTALPVIALIEAREAGVEVPREMLDGAIRCLERMYNPNGSYEYMLYVGQGDGPRGTKRPGAAGRGPLCSLALLKAGRTDLDRIRQSLDIFMEHRDSYAVLHRKSLMHTGPDAQGSHYLMFDYAFAAAAIGSLPLKERSRYAKPLIDQILGARSEDGSFVDNPINGPHYATAKALIALGHLDPGSR